MCSLLAGCRPAARFGRLSRMTTYPPWRLRLLQRRDGSPKRGHHQVMRSVLGDAPRISQHEFVSQTRRQSDATDPVAGSPTRPTSVDRCGSRFRRGHAEHPTQLVVGEPNLRHSLTMLKSSSCNVKKVKMRFSSANKVCASQFAISRLRLTSLAVSRIDVKFEQSA